MKWLLLAIALLLIASSAGIYIAELHEQRALAAQPMQYVNICDLASTWQTHEDIPLQLTAQINFAEHSVDLSCKDNNFSAVLEGGDKDAWSKLIAIKTSSNTWSFPVVVEGHILGVPLHRRLFWKLTGEQQQFPVFVLQKLVATSAPPPAPHEPPPFRIHFSTDKRTYHLNENVLVDVRIENISASKIYIRNPIQWGYGNASLSFDLAHAHSGKLADRWTFDEGLLPPSSTADYLLLKPHKSVETDAIFTLQEMGIDTPGESTSRVNFHDAVSRYSNFGLPVYVQPVASNPVTLRIIP
jgi:hypothetical protein